MDNKTGDYRTREDTTLLNQLDLTQPFSVNVTLKFLQIIFSQSTFVLYVSLKTLCLPRGVHNRYSKCTFNLQMRIKKFLH